MAVNVPGIKPGQPTTYYLKQIMKRITFIGAIFFSNFATLPNVIETLLNVSNLKGLGTTSLLILVGVTIRYDSRKFEVLSCLIFIKIC